MQVLEIILKWIPRIFKIVKKAIDEKASDEEIRRRIASSDVILESELATLRSRKQDLKDYIESGS